MPIHSIARFIQKFPVSSSLLLRQMARMDNPSPISAAARWISVVANRFPHSNGEERARSSFGTDRLPVSLFTATSTTAHASYSISDTPVLGGAGR